MRRFAVPGTVTLVALGLLAVLTYGVAHSTTTSSIPDQLARGHYPLAPNYRMALPVLDSHTTDSLADLKGKLVLLNVFASWCEPCQAEAPLLERAEQMMAAHGGTVVGVTYQDNASDDVAFARKYHLTFPILRDVNGSFVAPYGLTGVPDTYLIDRRGRIHAMQIYPVTQQWLNQTLASVLRGLA